MPASNLNPDTLPLPVEQAIKRLGGNIAIARKRREIRQEELAKKAGITKVTERRVENGNPTTSIGNYFAVLWALGLEAEIANLAAPERDEEGRNRERARMPKRTRPSQAGLDDDF